MKAHLDTHLLVPRSRSSAKVEVKYQGHIFKKNGRFGGNSVSQTHLVSICFLYFVSHFHQFSQTESVVGKSLQFVFRSKLILDCTLSASISCKGNYSYERRFTGLSLSVISHSVPLTN